MGNILSDTTDAIKEYIPGIKILRMSDAYTMMNVNETQDDYLKSVMESDANLAALQKIQLRPCEPPSSAEEMSKSAIMGVPAALKPSGDVSIGFFEAGLPHTRPPNTIWFPESVLTSTQKKFNETFLHECIHLHQREHVEQWRDFYESAWGFKPLPKSKKLVRDVEERRRINPDTIREPLYIWRDQYIPVVVYKNPSDANLREVRLIFCRPDGSWASVAPPGWMELFGTLEPSICEHPHEMAAYFLSDNENPFDSIAARKIRAWLSNK